MQGSHGVAHLSEHFHFRIITIYITEPCPEKMSSKVSDMVLKPQKQPALLQEAARVLIFCT